MAAYSRVYDSHHLQADCQVPRWALKPYARQSSMGHLFKQLPHLYSYLALNSRQLITIAMFIAVNIKLELMMLPELIQTWYFFCNLQTQDHRQHYCCYQDWWVPIAPYKTPILTDLYRFLFHLIITKKYNCMLKGFLHCVQRKKRHPDVLAITLSNLSYFQWCNINGIKTDVLGISFK